MVDLEKLFPRMTAVDLRHLRGIVAHEVHAAGSVLFREGDVITSIFAIDSGTVTVRKGSDAGVVVAELGDGDFVGEMSFLDGAPVSATVAAKTDVAMLRFPREALAALIEEHPALGARLFHSLGAVLSQRLRKMTEQYSVAMT